jgi:gliding motility-associated-like protein
MKRFIYLFILIASATPVMSQCFQIQSILVDACAGSQEGQNEMVTFRVGSAALNTANLSVNWPNNNWLGLTKNAGTAADVATVNATINGCGLLKEPTSNILPANAKVLLVTSTAWTPLAQSFVNLTDTLYIIFQTAGNTSGHFANFGTGLRTLSMTFSSPAGCTDAVTYNRALLINQAGALGSQDGGAVEFSPSGIASYINNGCQAPFIPLSVNAGPDKAICYGSTQSFTATASGAYTSVSWSLGSGAGGNFAPTNSLITTYTPGAAETGTVKLYCSILKSCGSQTTIVKDSVLLTITPQPTVIANPSVVSICSGGSAIIQANVNTPVVYSWSTGATTNSVSLNAAGIYTVNVSNACGNASATVSVSLSATPVLSLTSSSSSLCAGGQTATLSLSGSLGTYSWSTGASTSSLIMTSPGWYTATLSTAGCGTATASLTIASVPLPTISISAPATTVCAGSSLTFTANSNGTNYLWTGGVTTQTISVNTPSIVVTTTNVCGRAQATQTLSVMPLPTVTVSPSVVNLCAGQSAIVQAGSNTTVSYSWSTGTTTNSVSVNTPGIYTVTVSNVCGSATETASVSTATSPGILASASQTLLCPGQTATLSLTGSTGTYFWSDGATTPTTSANNAGVYTVTLTNSCGQAVSSVSIAAVPTPTVSIFSTSTTLCSGTSCTLTAVSNSGNYIWNTGDNISSIVVNTTGIKTVTVSNACGLATASVSINSVTSAPLILTSSSNSICPNETATLTVTGGLPLTIGSPVIYSWSNSLNTGSVVSTTGGTISVSNTNACGTNTSSIVVTVNPVNADIIASPVSGYSPLTVSFVNNSTNATTYLWDFGNGNIAGTATVTDQVYNSPGAYMAYLTVTDGICMDVDSVVIDVLMDEPTLYVPNAFTPNGDSINDVFWIGATNIKDFNIVIFDRWGLKLFESSDLLVSWNGKVNGKEVADGCYFYLINAKGIDDKQIKKQGTVTLFK